MVPSICKKWWKILLKTNNKCVSIHHTLRHRQIHIPYPYGIGRCLAKSKIAMLDTICYMMPLSHFMSGTHLWQIQLWLQKKTPTKFKSPTHQSYPQSLPCFNISLPYRHILHFKTMDNFRFDIITSFIVIIVIKSTLDDLALSNTKKWIPSYYLPKEKINVS